MIKEERTSILIKMSDKAIKLVVKDLNKVLDSHKIFGQEWNKQVIKELILQNLTLNTTTQLMKELDELPISDWND